MGRKQTVRMAADFFMAVLMPLLMSYSLLGEGPHEWIGAAMAALFMLHHLLNFGWRKNLLRGRYSPYRRVLTIVNGLLFADFLLLFYSGVDLSKHLLPFLPELGSASFSRMLHLFGSHWGLLLMSFHLGLHMPRLTVPLKKHRGLSAILAVLLCLTAFYGCYAFVAMDFTSYLLPSSAFLFFDAGQPFARLLAHMGSVMVLFAMLGLITARLTQHKVKKEIV